MIKVKIVFILCFVFLPHLAMAQTTKKSSSKAQTKKAAPRQTVRKATQPAKRVTEAPPLSPQLAAQLKQALQLVQAGQHQQAIPLLYSLSRRGEFQSERMQIKYIMGSSLMAIGLNQIAAFQFVEVIKNGNSRYVRSAIEKLSLAADALGDDTLLNYAISRIRIEEVPVNGRDLIYFRLAEIKQKSGQYAQAVDLYSKIPDGSRYFFLSRYNKGVTFLEMKRVKDAIDIFKALVSYKKRSRVTDTNRVIAQIGLARAYYQATDWDRSIEAYRSVPRDHYLWHEALFESSWALLRSARFRSVLSNFQSLHSSYYQDHYIPESLLLRSIVYLYICKYDEIEKVLDLFDKTYGNLPQKISGYLNSQKDPNFYFAEVEYANNYKYNRSSTYNPKLPLIVSYHVLREGNVKRSLLYLKSIIEEKSRLDSYTNISKSGIGALGRKILANRYQNARLNIGEMVRAHLENMVSELQELSEQAAFIKYEMINGKKESLKKRIAGKDLSQPDDDVTADRSVIVQNGFEFWPFDGEYWLDEIGNYHYMGKQSCE